MIVDVHTHVWQTPDQLGQADLGDPTADSARQAAGGRTVFSRIPPGDPELHWQAGKAVDRIIVLGFQSRLLKADVPNDFISDYVRRHPDKLIGFAGIDPTSKRAIDELQRCKDELRLAGLHISPGNQGIHPTDSRVMAVYEVAQRLGMPILFHGGGHLSEAACPEFARPILLDEVARAFPDLPMIVSQVGHPWVGETCGLLARHRRVYADIGGLLRRPWTAYNTLIQAFEHGVVGKLLFGSDFPYGRAAETIEKLFSVNFVAQGTNLPTVPRSALRGIIERDALSLLGLSP
ncbi:MAG: amidohydrolase family protein [Planctomycetota bacterium]